MNNELSSLDIGTLPDVVHLVEEVQRTRAPRVLRRDGKDVAVLMPLAPHTVRRAAGPAPRRSMPTAADRAAFRAAAGSWSDVDTETFVEELYERRRIATRPPIEL